MRWYLVGNRYVNCGTMCHYVPLCAYHHAVEQYQDGGDMKKEINVYLALKRATDDDLRPYCKVIDYIKMRDRLRMMYD